MKPIEIHIEGYKIIISKDEDKTGNNDKKDGITYVPEKSDDKDDPTLPYIPYKPYVVPNIPYVPQQPYDWWNHPYVTWTNDDIFNIDTTEPKITIVRDTMVGK